MNKLELIDTLRFEAELNRFAEGFHPPTGFYPPIFFSLLIQAILVYSTCR